MRKKLIEVALPLEAINAASAREKSIRHGHPSTLHLWWARRPLAACRAVLFAQLVDDPASVPEEFPDAAAQERERKRLFGIIEELVLWENSNDERVIGAARREIARSVARGLGEPAPQGKEEVNAFLAEKAPPVADPFCGGGSIPLEAQRLGLRAYGSDLNPVAVLITKALIEIPPRFAGMPPVNPEARAQKSVAGRDFRGAEGLAEDVRYYGRWMRDRAQERIGHLYPKARLPDGSEATVIAWLWARTVASPNPAARGAHVPLVSSFVLSSKKGREAIVVPVVENGGYRFTVRQGGVTADELARARKGTKAGRGANFTCLVSGTPIPGAHVKAEGKAGRMGARLLAVVAEGYRGRIYLAPAPAMEEAARVAAPEWVPRATISGSTQYLGIKPYGMERFDQLFTNRQLAALTTFADLVSEARGQARADAIAAGMDPEQTSLASGGDGAYAYADAVATYLGLSVSRQANRLSNLSFWNTARATVEQVFARQVLPIVWDFCEANPLSDSTGNFTGQVRYLAKVVESSPPAVANNAVKQADAATDHGALLPSCVFATDPPYYDNVPYSDISDFFYVWQRRTLGGTWPELFRTMLTPKSAELVAFAYRHDSKAAAEHFFMERMGRAVGRMRVAQPPDYPMALFYAYKQAETGSDKSGNGRTASTGWETMLAGIVDRGFAITGTWPVRTEITKALKKNLNVLASSIVIACRPRPADAPLATRRDFTSALRRELPPAIRQLQKENIAPVDLAQAAIGPGMGVFSRYAHVLEADGTPMPVRSALVEINWMLDETLAESEGVMDSDTRFCVAWFEQYGNTERAYGEAEVLFTAKNTSFGRIEKAGLISAGGGGANSPQVTR